MISIKNHLILRQSQKYQMVFYIHILSPIYYSCVACIKFILSCDIFHFPLVIIEKYYINFFKSHIKSSSVLIKLFAIEILSFDAALYLLIYSDTDCIPILHPSIRIFAA